MQEAVGVKPNPDIIDGAKQTIKTSFGNSYFFVSPEDIMLTVADENKYAQQELRVTTEAICRISSKAMKAKLSMPDIIEQLRKADNGRDTLLVALADGMQKYLDVNQEQ